MWTAPSGLKRSTPSAPFIFALLPIIQIHIYFSLLLVRHSIRLHPELAPNVQKNDDANERERGHEHLGRSDLQTRAVVGVELQDVLSAAGPTAATGRCCASLGCLLHSHDTYIASIINCRSRRNK